MSQHSILIAILIMLSVAAAMYALAYPYLSGDIKGQKRASALLSGSERAVASRGADPAKRRKLIAESLKDVEQKSSRKASLEQRIAQAGLSISKEVFLATSAGLGMLFGTILFITNGSPLVAFGGALAATFGVPSWVLTFLRQRRIAKFIDAFPGALDIIVRGVKAGLPVADCFRVIAGEVDEPVRGEFRKIIESQSLGLSIAEATERFAERVPVPEASFFAIVINVQQKAGGNLSETLQNLSNVLRDRKKMKGKIKAMSSEAKASAGIIGSLPFLVGGAVWFMTPSYMMVLFTTPQGKFIIACSLLWMAIGVFIMRKMINFEI
jgi:tight adherence protein B